MFHHAIKFMTLINSKRVPCFCCGSSTKAKLMCYYIGSGFLFGVFPFSVSFRSGQARGSTSAPLIKSVAVFVPNTGLFS